MRRATDLTRVLEGLVALVESSKVESSRAESRETTLEKTSAVLHATFEGDPAPSRLSFDVRMLANFLAELVTIGGGPTYGLTVMSDGHTLYVGESIIDISRRRAFPGIVHALVDARLRRPGEGLTSDDLLAAGWPDEAVLPEAGINRVRTAIRTLRDLGLRGALETRGNTYLFAETLPVRWHRLTGPSTSSPFTT
jgi:hypothetical protein